MARIIPGVIVSMQGAIHLMRSWIAAATTFLVFHISFFSYYLCYTAPHLDRIWVIGGLFLCGTSGIIARYLTEKQSRAIFYMNRRLGNV